MLKNLLPPPATELCFLSHPPHSVVTQNFISWYHGMELYSSLTYVRLICMIYSVVVKCCSKHVAVKCVGNGVKFSWADSCVRWFKCAAVSETDFIFIVKVLTHIKTLVMETASISEMLVHLNHLIQLLPENILLYSVIMQASRHNVVEVHLLFSDLALV
jgi:hypothetical protein